MKTLIDRFQDKYFEDVYSGCFRWIAWQNADGYGGFMVNGVKKRAHRVAWEMVNGPIPDGMHVLHTCDNPECVNPQHLFLGNHTDNIHDMIQKGRLPADRNFLTEKEVTEILSMDGTLREVAEEFNVSHVTIWDIRHNNTWQHISRERLDNLSTSETSDRCNQIVSE